MEQLILGLEYFTFINSAPRSLQQSPEGLVALLSDARRPRMSAEWTGENIGDSIYAPRAAGDVLGGRLRDSVWAPPTWTA